MIAAGHTDASLDRSIGEKRSTASAQRITDLREMKNARFAIKKTPKGEDHEPIHDSKTQALAKSAALQTAYAALTRFDTNDYSTVSTPCDEPDAPASPEFSLSQVMAIPTIKADNSESAAAKM
jgi:hypothetical protein